VERSDISSAEMKMNSNSANKAIGPTKLQNPKYQVASSHKNGGANLRSGNLTERQQVRAQRAAVSHRQEHLGGGAAGGGTSDSLVVQQSKGGAAAALRAKDFALTQRPTT
jgi:hypothetical protein